MANQQSAPPSVLSPHGQLCLGTIQENLVSGATVKVLLDTIETGFTDGIEDTVNNRITPAVLGLYQVTAQIYYMGVVANKRYGLRVKSSVDLWVIDGLVHSGEAQNLAVLVSRTMYLSDVEYLELYAQHFAGVDTISINSDSEYTFLSVVRVK